MLLKFFDRDLNLQGNPTNIVRIKQFRKRINTADHATFSLPNTDDFLEQLSYSAYVMLHDTLGQVVAGTLQSRDATGEELELSLQGHAHRLKQYKTPKRWETWNGMDLADVVREHTQQFKNKRWNTKEDWEQAQAYQVDLNIEPGSVVLQYEPHPEDPTNERPKPYGYIQVRYDMGADSLPTKRLIRWSETVGSDVRVTIQSRSASTSGGLAGASWTTELRAVHVAEIENNETIGVPVADGGRWVDIRVNLYTDDQTTPHKGSDGHTNGYGFTPILEGLELIWREPFFLEVGNIPPQTGITVQGFLFDRIDFLRSLNELCTAYGWEFVVEHDEEEQKIFLHLGENRGGVWNSTIGRDKTSSSDHPIVLRHGADAEIVVLRDDPTGMINILSCWGAGDGAKQLYTELKNEESIAVYGELPGDFESMDASTMAELIAAGQAELAERSYPKVAFEVNVPVARKGILAHAGLGDHVTVVHPHRGLLLDTRIEEYNFSASAGNEGVRLGLGDFLYNPIEKLVQKTPSSRILPDIPERIKQVIAHPNFGYIVVTWGGNADSYAVRARTDSGVWKYFDSTNTTFTHQQLAVGSVWEYQVAAITNKRMGEWSDIVSAEVLDMQVEDPNPPEPATNLKLTEKSFYSTDGVVVLAVEVTWNKSVSEHAHQQFIERASSGGYIPIATVDKDAEVYQDTQGLVEGGTYSYRVKTVSRAGVYSAEDPVKAITLQGTTTIPSTPQNLVVSVNDDGEVILNWSMVDQKQFLDYMIEISTSSSFASVQKTYYSPSNTFNLTGVYTDTTVYARVRTRDRKHNVGSPSNVVSINIPDLLSNRIAATYLAQQTYQKLLDNFFFGEDDGYFDGGNIKPATVETQHLAVGAGTRNFQLVGVKMEANDGGTRGRFSNTAGYLILATGVGESAKVWNISAKTQQQTLNRQLYVYARCSKSSTSGEILFSTTRPAIEDSSYYYYLIGMYFTDDDPAVLAVSYGFTYINGSHITTGTIDANMVRILATGSHGSIEISGVGIIFRDSNDNISIRMSTQTGDAYFRGVVEAEAIILPVKPY